MIYPLLALRLLVGLTVQYNAQSSIHLPHNVSHSKEAQHAALRVLISAVVCCSSSVSTAICISKHMFGERYSTLLLAVVVLLSSDKVRCVTQAYTI
jgi:hypothetical protein